MHRVPSFLTGASAPKLKVKLFYNAKRPLALDRASLMSNSDSITNESRLPGNPSAHTTPVGSVTLFIATPPCGINHIRVCKTRDGSSIGLDR